ncbi:putative DNA-binding protein [Paratrimastix pyriformis]|uniref:DNA-binding protein n=1 Tax=Paratrimastix pyriformis TaxID=342808 RepID=A0ABQ8UP90_9EUKA|nr:putative DNA-binding protein [Paratrimastix pyriformis]
MNPNLSFLLVVLVAFAYTLAYDCDTSSAKLVAARFKPHEDLYQKIDDLVKTKHLHAAYIATCVGSLTQATIRFANQSDLTTLQGPFEITSLVGTLSDVGGHHIHITVCDGAGKCQGGHFVGGLIYTTAELVIGVAPDLAFVREYVPPPDSGYEELVVKCATP